MGSITFVPEKGNAKTGAIQDGKYTVDEVPLGDAKVTITVPMPVATGGPPGKGGAGPPPGKGVVPKDAPVPQGFDPSKANAAAAIKIPLTYADGSTTPLKHTVVAGKQTKDFELK